MTDAAGSERHDPAADDRARAAETIEGQLARRGVRLHDGEGGEELADALSAVEEFEAAVRRRGGDSFTNTPSSSRPDDPAFVIPARTADEGLAAYARRVRRAASELGGA